MAQDSTAPIPETLTVTRLSDPIVERLGHPVQGRYVERFWTATLGPTALLALRALDQLCSEHDDELVTVELGELARQLGVRHGPGRHSVMRRSLTRLHQAGAVELHGSLIRVRGALAGLRAGQLARLSAAQRAAHDALAGASTRR